MGLLSFLKRTGASASAAEAGDDMQRVRTRARQRLIGALVLIIAGVLGFPLLFETQPRPIAVDVPIEIARKDQVPPLVMPPARARAASATASAAAAASRPAQKESVITETASEAGREVAAAASKPVAASAPPSAPQPKAERPATPPAVAAVAPARVAPGSVEPRPRVAPDTKVAAVKEPAKKDDGANAQGRFVLQVGAFSDVASAREVRQKVEKLGLKTYTQVIETSDGRRIRVRVGPFASRDDAEKAADKVKAAGLQTALFPI